MPEPAAATLEATISAAVEARRQTIEALIREAVDRELPELVEREVDAALERLAEQRTNGATPAPSSSSTPPATSTTELCASCGTRPRAPGRALCQPCRTARARERRTSAVTAHETASADETRPADPEPAPAVDDHQAHVTAQTLAVRVRRRGITEPLSAGELQRWLLRERLATVHDGRLVATARGHAIGGAIA